MTNKCLHSKTLHPALEQKYRTKRKGIICLSFMQMFNLQCRTWSCFSRIVKILNFITCVLCISTSFQMLAATDSWLKHFFQPFSKFFVNFKPFFSDFKPEIIKKHLKTLKKSLKWTKRLKMVKKVFLAAFRCCKHLKTGRNTQNLWTEFLTIKGILF